MSKSEIIGTSSLGLVSLMAIFAWAMNIWGGWAEKTYERANNSVTVQASLTAFA
jgi:hypothetical protein